ncbi:MAG: enoyl-ACP reductase [Alphaproteobacteria bacterium TMED87]|nr:MAG: enoyl-ACP reductase [Alphaproteobacteria bacterium TMED87]
MGSLKNKRGLIMGVANERSIAWGIAKAISEQGAELAFTYQGEQFGRRLKPLAKSIGSKLTYEVDVTNDVSLDRCFNDLSQEWDSIDFLVHAIAYSDKSELTGRFLNTTRKNFLNTLNISTYSFIEVARRAHPLMKDKGGSLISLSYLGSNRVSPFYNVMGIAKAGLESTTRYLASDLGPDKIRVNAISPGPMRTLAGASVGGARKTYKFTELNAPLGSNATLEAVGGTAVYLISDAGKLTSGEIIVVDGGYHIMGMPRAENI